MWVTILLRCMSQCKASCRGPCTSVLKCSCKCQKDKLEDPCQPVRLLHPSRMAKEIRGWEIPLWFGSAACRSALVACRPARPLALRQFLTRCSLGKIATIPHCFLGSGAMATSSSPTSFPSGSAPTVLTRAFAQRNVWSHSFVQRLLSGKSGKILLPGLSKWPPVHVEISLLPLNRPWQCARFPIALGRAIAFEKALPKERRRFATGRPLFLTLRGTVGAWCATGGQPAEPGGPGTASHHEEGAAPEEDIKALTSLHVFFRSAPLFVGSKQYSSHLGAARFYMGVAFGNFHVVILAQETA